jgi:hypothetical protein
VFSFIGCHQGVEIVKEYDRKNIALGMFFRCYYHLHQLSQSKAIVVDGGAIVDGNPYFL